MTEAERRVADAIARSALHGETVTIGATGALLEDIEEKLYSESEESFSGLRTEFFGSQDGRPWHVCTKDEEPNRG